MKALVTGGAGFIGSTLVDRLLAEGHSVDVVDDLSSGSLANLAEARADRGNDLKVHQVDIRDPAVVELIGRRQPEVVFHLAAQADVRVSVARPGLRRRGQRPRQPQRPRGGAGRRARARSCSPRAAARSTASPPPAELPVKESHPQQPLSPYGVAKKVVTDYLHVYRELHSIEFTSLALANIYGPRQDPHGEAGVVAIFAGLLLEGKPCTIFGDGEQTRDFVYVDDVVDAFVRAADRGSGLLCNIGTGVETSVNELYAAMAERGRGRPSPPSTRPPRPGELAAQRPRPRPGGPPPRLGAVDRPADRRRRGPPLVPRLSRTAA